MDITYRFIASGQGDVEKAFTGIEQAARRQKKAIDDAGKASRGATAPAAAKARTTDAERTARAQERAQARSATAAERAAKRGADAQVREQERAQKHVARIKDRHFADEQRKAERSAKESARKEIAARQRAQRESSANRKQSFGTLKDIGSGALLGGVATGSAMIAGAARESMKLQEQSSRIAIAGRAAGDKMRDPNELRRGFERTAINAPGQTASGIADAVARFVSLTGDLDTALKSQSSFAMIASASGAGVGDVAETAASLSQQFDVKSVEDMTEALAALNFQGKNGAFELKDMASQMQALAAAGGAFGLPKGVQGVKILGGLTQIARTSTRSGEEAATGVSALFRQFGSRQKELKTAGVDVFKDGKVRDIRDLVVESISKVGGTDAGKKQAGLQEIFGDEGLKAIKSLVSQYNEEFAKTAGTDADKTAAATKALRDRFAKAIDTVDAVAESEQDAAVAQKDASAQLTGAWESIKAKVGDALLPALATLAEKLGGEGSMLDPFIEAAGLAAEALIGLHDFLQDKGLITKKQKSKAELAEEAQKDIAKYKREHGVTDDMIGPMAPELFALQERAKTASDAVFEKAGTSGKGMSKDDFVTQYMAAGGMAADDRDSVAMLAGALQKNPADAFRSNDFAMGVLGGENQQQQDVRRQFQASVTADKTLGQDKAAQDLSALATNAVAASQALAKIAANGQGSIVSGQ